MKFRSDGSTVRRVKPFSSFCAAIVVRVFLGDAQTVPDHLSQRPERHSVPIGEAASTMPQHFGGQAVDVFLEFPSKTGLTHPLPGQ